VELLQEQVQQQGEQLQQQDEQLQRVLVGMNAAVVGVLVNDDVEAQDADSA